MAQARFRKAARWVVVLSLAVTGALLVSHAAERGGAGAQVLRVGDAPLVEALMRSEDGADMDARILGGAGLVRFDATEAPDWFSEELFDPTPLRWGIATQDWGLVGFACEGDGEEALRTIEGALEERGWVRHADDAESARTLLKQEGRCRWMAISYAHGGSATNIVLHIQHD